MKILLLVCTVVWSFSGICPTTNLIVESPEEAAIIIYNNRPSSFVVEPDRREWILYEIDLKSNTIKEVKIPKIEFKEAL